jgi:phosphatidylglycerol:prolipoprotein diacylglycerol transferase
MFGFYLHDLDPIIFRLWDNVGPRWYGMAYVLAFICAYVLLRQLSKRDYLELPVARVADFVTWAALFGVMLGGRLGYVFFYRPEMLREPLSILRVWEGGMSSHGGIIGLFLFTLYYARRHKVSWTNVGDNVVVAAPIGLFFGRCANFINCEHAIAACQRIDPSLSAPETIVAAVRHNPQVKETLRTILTPRHPSQLYEAFFEGLVLFLILWIVRTKFRTRNGVLTGLFFICYAILRIFAENFREPDAPLVGAFTRGQFFSFFLILIGIGFLLAARLGKTARAPR